MLVIGQTADSISMMLDAIRTVSDRVSYCDDEPTLNVVVIRQLVAENNVSGNALKLQFNIFLRFSQDQQVGFHPLWCSGHFIKLEQWECW